MRKCVVCGPKIKNKDRVSYWRDDSGRKHYACFTDTVNGEFDRWIDEQFINLGQEDKEE